MKIVVYLTEKEANRQIEDDDENIRAAYLQVVRELENVMCKYQIRYEEIEVSDHNMDDD